MFVATSATGGKFALLELTDNPTPISASTTQYTFTNAAIGAAAADRHVLVCIGCTVSVPSRTLTSVTIGGNAATIHVNQAASVAASSSFVAAIAGLTVAAGTTATVVANFSGNMTSCFCQVYRMVKQISTTPFATGGSASTTLVGSRSSTCNIPGRGAFLACGGLLVNASSLAMTGATEQVEQAVAAFALFHSGRNFRMAAETARAFSSTVNSGTGPYALAAASWQ
jgi:hypothetical protein